MALGEDRLSTSEQFGQKADAVKSKSDEKASEGALDPLNLPALEEAFTNLYGGAPEAFAPEVFKPEPIPDEILNLVSMQQGYHKKYLDGLLTFSENFMNRVSFRQTNALTNIQDVLGADFSGKVSRAGAQSKAAEQNLGEDLSDFYAKALNISQLNLQRDRATRQTEALPKAQGNILNLDAMLKGADIDQETAAFRSFAEAQELGQKSKLGLQGQQSSLDILKEGLASERIVQNLQVQGRINQQEADKKSAIGGVVGNVLSKVISLFG